jgi:cytochrome bd-type quinol oxidase subunit 2
VFNLFRHYRPLLFFGSLSVVLGIGSILTGLPVIYEYFRYAYVYKVPSAILAAALMLLAMLSVAIGLILDTISAIDKKNYQIHLNHFPN